MQNNLSIFDLYSEKYEEVSILKSSSICQTYLVINKETNEKYISKITKQKSDLYEMIKGISHKSLPKIYEIYTEDETTIIIEEFIEGKNLSELIKENKTFSKKEILNISIQLCNILKILHKKHIIHRDIKPSNIIIKPDNTVVLIDFDASRFSDTTKNNDTVIIGTKGYAPPEQYGFAQTDERTDIYALGITLKELLGKNYTKSPLYKPISKAIKIDPKNRYKNISKFYISLKYRTLKKCIKIIFTLLFLYLIISISNYFTQKNQVSQNSHNLEEYNTNYDTSFNVGTSSTENINLIHKYNLLERLPYEDIYIYENFKYGVSAIFPDFFELDIYNSDNNSIILRGFDDTNNFHYLTFYSKEATLYLNNELSIDLIRKELNNYGKLISSSTIGKRTFLTFDNSINEFNKLYNSYVLYTDSKTNLFSTMELSSKSSLDIHNKLLENITNGYVAPFFEIPHNMYINNTFDPVLDFSKLNNLDIITIVNLAEYLTNRQISYKYEQTISSEDEITHIFKINSNLDPKNTAYIYVSHKFDDSIYLNVDKWTISDVKIDK